MKTKNKFKLEPQPKNLSLRPYPGSIELFTDIQKYKERYYELTGKTYPYKDESTGGRYVYIDFDGPTCENVFLVLSGSNAALAHELSHCILHTFEFCGIDPIASKGEPFCYMLSQLMIDAGA